jgi:hypothetical protein
MSKIYDLLPGAFAGATAPFGSHPSDAARAQRYLEAAMRHGLSWDDVEKDIRRYLENQNCNAEEVKKQLMYAYSMLGPWLDIHHDVKAPNPYLDKLS